MGDVDQARTAAAAMMPTIKERRSTRWWRFPRSRSPGTRRSPFTRWPTPCSACSKRSASRTRLCRRCPTGYPPIYGTLEGPPGSPVVMLYAHYDVQPAPPEQGWTSDPWTPTKKDDGRVYGRGAADDKGGLAIHLGTLRYFEGSPPCTIKLIVEGMEETSSNLEPFVEAHPDLFDCDLFVVCDMGNPRRASPTLTTTLRGDVACVVTGEDPRAPTAFGRVRRSRARRDDGPREVARDPARRPGQRRGRRRDLVRLGRAWTSANRTSGPARTCSTVPRLSGAARWDRACGPTRRSRRSGSTRPRSTDPRTCYCRPPSQALDADRPGLDPKKELDALVRHLETHAPWGATVEVERTKEAPPFRCETGGPGYAAARVALQDAYGSAPGEAGSGGSIPLLRRCNRRRPARSSSCGVPRTSRSPGSTRRTRASTPRRSRR